MIVHATVEQLADEPWNLTPTNAAALLRSASLLIDRELVGAWYATNTSGAAIDTAVLQALADATCAQVAAWVALGIDPLKGAADTDPAKVVKSTSLGTGRIEYDTGSTQDRAIVQAARAQVATELAPEAAQILAAAGLLTTRVVTYG